MALDIACNSGSKEIVELLLEAGAQARINAFGKVNQSLSPEIRSIFFFL